MTTSELPADELSPEDTLLFRSAPENFRVPLRNAIQKATADYQTLLKNNDPITYKNLVLAINTLLKPVHRINSYLTILDIQDTSTFGKIQKEAGAEVAELEGKIFSNGILAKRMQALMNAYEEDNNVFTDAGEHDFSLILYRKFEENGAFRPIDDRRIIKRLRKTLAEKCARFRDNLNEGMEYHAELFWNEEELAGVPDNLKEAYQKKAEMVRQELADNPKSKWNYLREEYKKAGDSPCWLVIPERLEVEYLLTVAKNYSFRDRIEQAYETIGMDSPCNNSDIIMEIQRLRHNIAKKLGSDNHAEFVHKESYLNVLGDKTPAKYLESILGIFLTRFQKDVEAIRETVVQTPGLASTISFDEDHFYSCDFPYAARQHFKKIGFDSTEFLQYLTVEDTLEGLCQTIKDLYPGCSMSEDTTCPTRFLEEKIYKLTMESPEGQKAEHKYIHFDLYKRPGKKGLSWSAATPEHIFVVMNLEKPSVKGEKTCMGLPQYRILFHEFGHACDSLHERGDPRGLQTNIETVEFASSFMELMSLRHLPAIARHYQTGDKSDPRTIQAAQEMLSFDLRLQMMKYALNGWKDQKFHEADLDHFTFHSLQTSLVWPKSCSEYKHLRPCIPSYSLTQFLHLATTSPDYSARYYLYALGCVLGANLDKFLEDKKADETPDTKIITKPIHWARLANMLGVDTSWIEKEINRRKAVATQTGQTQTGT